MAFQAKPFAWQSRRGLKSKLERFTNLLNRKGFRSQGEYDSRCWLDRRPASDGQTSSGDLRKRVVAAVSKGESCRVAAARWGCRILAGEVVAALPGEGSVKPGKMGGYRKSVLVPHGDFIKERIRQTPHLTLHALKDELATRGVDVSHNAVWLFMRREGLRFKKSCSLLSRAALM